MNTKMLIVLSIIEKSIVQREECKKEFTLKLLRLKRRLVISTTQLKSILSNMNSENQNAK